MPGVPRATYMPYPCQIAQGRGAETIRYLFACARRIIHSRGEIGLRWYVYSQRG